MSITDPPKHDAVVPDMFSYYSRAVAELLRNDDDEKDISRTCTDSMLFDDVIGARLSDSKREKLKALLRQGVFILTPEVDEIFESVTKLCNLELLMRRYMQQDTCSDTSSDCEIIECAPLKKLRMSSPASSASVSVHESPIRDETYGEVDDHYPLLMMLKKDSSKVEALLKKHSDELYGELENMGQRLEEVLDTVMSKCRLMTSSEKEQLKSQVLKLPKDKLGRAAEIIGCRRGSETESNLADVERVDNITLWRLYYHVESLQKESVAMV